MIRWGKKKLMLLFLFSFHDTPNPSCVSGFFMCGRMAGWLAGFGKKQVENVAAEGFTAGRGGRDWGHCLAGLEVTISGGTMRALMALCL